MRPVRLSESALDDIEVQLPADRIEEFRLYDLRLALVALVALSKDEAIWNEFGIPHGPGRRFTLGGRTVAGFHLFVTEDSTDPRLGAVVVFGIDVWLDDFPG